MYYKSAIAQKNKIDLTVNISLELHSILSKLSEKEVKVLCHLIGIYFDNAIEAAKETRKNNTNKRHSNNNNYITYETVIMRNFYEYIKSFTSNKIRDSLYGMVKTLELEQGRTEVAKALQNMPLQFHEILARCGYDSDKALMEFETSFLEYFPNVSEQYKKDLMEKLEYNEMGYEEYED